MTSAHLMVPLLIVLRRGYYSVGLFFYFVYKLVSANVRLTQDILRSKVDFESACLAYKAKDLKPFELFLLANIVSLTPGSLTIDVDADEKVIYLHTLYARDYDQIMRELDQITSMIMRATRTR